MTEIRCPNCRGMNPLSALQCENCSLPFSNLPSSAFITTEPVFHSPPQTYFGQLYEHPAPQYGYTPRIDTELGRKTFMWYRVYCGALMVLYLAVAVIGVALVTLAPETREYSSEETVIMGVIYGLLGGVFFFVNLVALLLPAKPYNWIVGIVMIAIGMTSCCLWPATIPLLIYWIKPETKAFFGRK